MTTMQPQSFLSSGEEEKNYSKCPEGHEYPRPAPFLNYKTFNVNDSDIRQDIVYNVSLWVTLIYHPKYIFPGVNSLQDMKKTCRAIKYRLLTYTFFRN